MTVSRDYLFEYVCRISVRHSHFPPRRCADATVSTSLLPVELHLTVGRADRYLLEGVAVADYTRVCLQSFGVDWQLFTQVARTFGPRDRSYAAETPILEPKWLRPCPQVRRIVLSAENLVDRKEVVVCERSQVERSRARSGQRNRYIQLSGATNSVNRTS